ncbi:hypothetical protein J6590_095924 [Homalodisca vitripennis]|nr:hypothetical protein J6590_095924 [Homalodisca vitripennis]
MVMRHTVERRCDLPSTLAELTSVMLATAVICRLRWRQLKLLNLVQTRSVTVALFMITILLYRLTPDSDSHTGQCPTKAGRIRLCAFL